MNYDVILTEDFKKYFKRLSKKYPSLKTDLLKLIEKLESDFKVDEATDSFIFLLIPRSYNRV